MARRDLQLSSLVIATDVDTLPESAIVEDRGDHVVVRSPSNPSHYWGNFLLYRSAPASGDRERWEADFDRAFGSDRESRHAAFTWDRIDGHAGAVGEFVDAGYEHEDQVALVAQRHELHAHARACEDVEVRLLRPDGDEELWDAVVQLQVDNREAGHEEGLHRTFVQRRLDDRRERFLRGEGGWFLALVDGEPAASCGVIVTAGRGRYQAVDTLERFRRRGIASRLVHDAGRAALDRFGAERLVIVADADYHALPLYESLGFVRRHVTPATCWWPGAPRAGRHPRNGVGAPAPGQPPAT